MLSESLAAILLGIIEGITEFLPVSSTGHLLIAEEWLPRQSDLFNVLIQSGAVLAVLFVFSKRIWELFSGWKDPENQAYLLKLALSFFLTVVGGILLQIMNYELPGSAVPVALATLVGGVLILLIEYGIRGKKLSQEITWKIAALIALGQLAAAIFPGLSRSGTTVLLALFLGVSRPRAVEFSFLLGVPTLLAAGALKTFEALQSDIPHDWNFIWLGTISSALTAFLVVKWLLRFIQKHTFTGFGWYRIILGISILALL